MQERSAKCFSEVRWGVPCLCLFQWLVVRLTVKVVRLSLAIQCCMVIPVSRLIFGSLQSVCMDEKCSVQSRFGLFSPFLTTTQRSKITQTSNKTWICSSLSLCVCRTKHVQKNIFNIVCGARTVRQRSMSGSYQKLSSAAAWTMQRPIHLACGPL